MDNVLLLFSTGNKNLLTETTKDNYQRITLMKEGVKMRYQAHRLVALAFIPNPENKPFINHIDGNKSNNKASNLEWCTAKENTKHAEIMGLRTHKNTILRKDSKLTREEAFTIKELINQGMSTNEIKKIIPKANPKNVYAIKNNLSYKL